MKKIIFLIVMTLLALNSCRANASEKTFYHYKEAHGYVWVCVDRFSYTGSGKACTSAYSRNAWRVPGEVIPRGRKYTGYKINGETVKIFYT